MQDRVGDGDDGSKATPTIRSVLTVVGSLGEHTSKGGVGQQMGFLEANNGLSMLQGIQDAVKCAEASLAKASHIPTNKRDRESGWGRFPRAEVVALTRGRGGGGGGGSSNRRLEASCRLGDAVHNAGGHARRGGTCRGGGGRGSSAGGRGSGGARGGCKLGGGGTGTGSQVRGGGFLW